MPLKTVLLIALMSVVMGCSGNQGSAGTKSERADNDKASLAEPVAGNVPAVPSVATGDANIIGTVGTPVAGAESTGSSDAATPSTAAACSKRGGTWRRAGIMRLEVCDLPTADAGKACRGDADCESVCIAPEGAPPSGPVTGQCYRSNITVGTCLTLVEDGRIAQAQCAD